MASEYDANKWLIDFVKENKLSDTQSLMDERKPLNFMDEIETPADVNDSTTWKF